MPSSAQEVTMLFKLIIAAKDSWACLQLDKLDDRRQHLCHRFALKCLTNEKTRNMFPLKKNKHIMKLRNSEKYDVQYDKTQRLQNSPIIHMQKLLNEN